jgi:hypothetical protein
MHIQPRFRDIDTYEHETAPGERSPSARPILANASTMLWQPFGLIGGKRGAPT